MSRHDGRIAFTQDVLAQQARNGSRHQDAPVGATDAPVADRLGPAERAFLADRDGSSVASTGATGWPYVQDRGGSPGFLRVLDDAGQRRLELYGRARVQDAQDAPDLLAALAYGTGPAAVERVVTVAVAAYDWTCPRHIVRRCTARELSPQVAGLVGEVEALREGNRALRDQLRRAVAAGAEAS